MAGKQIARRAASTCALALLLVLGACSSDDGGDRLALADPEAEATGAVSDPPPVRASAPEATSDEPVDGEVLLGRNPARSAAEEEVVATWFAYWTELFRMYAEVEPDRQTLATLARGKAASGPLDYVAGMQRQQVHQVGGAIAGVTGLRVRGDRATVETCFRNSALNVTDDGERPVEPLAPFFRTREVLLKEGPDWRVIRSINIDDSQRCRFR